MITPTKTLNRRLNRSRTDPIPSYYETRLYKPIRGLFSSLWRRLKPQYIKLFKDELGLQETETKAVSDKTPKWPQPVVVEDSDIADDPNTKKYVASFVSLFLASDKTAYVFADQADASQNKIRSEATYQHMAAQQLELCQETMNEMVAASNLKSKQLIDAAVMGAVQEKVKGGKTLLSLTREMEKWFSAESNWRARRIAHTESARAYNGGIVNAAMNDDDVVGLEWILSDDACPLCQKIGIDENGLPRQVSKQTPFAFQSKSTTPNIYKIISYPPLHPNCRCAVATVQNFEPTRFSDMAILEGNKVVGVPQTPVEKPPIIDLGNLPIYKPEPKPRKPRKKKTDVVQTVDAIPVTKPDTAPTPITVTTGFPATVTDLEFVKTLGGSTGAQLVRDPLTGQLYVRKYGSNTSDDHLRSEFYADELYRSMGVPVPDSMLYETSSGAVKLAKYIDGGRPISDLSGFELEKAVGKVVKHFAVDAILGNWDVFGMSGDNILVAPDGTPYRIDNGGSLEYRAQGEKKSTLGPKLWTEFPVDLWTIDDATINKTTAPNILKGMTAEERFDSVRILPDPAGFQMSAKVPDNIQDMIRKRILNAGESLREYDMLATYDKFTDEHANEFARASMNYKNEDVFEHVAKVSIEAPYDPADVRKSGSLVDEKGRTVTKFYGNYDDHDSPYRRFVDTIYKYDFRKEFRAFTYYMGRQAGSSRSNESLAMKKFFTEHVIKYQNPEKDLYWHGYDANEIDKKYKEYLADFNVDTDRMKRMVAWQHAYTYNLLRELPLRWKSDDNNRIAVNRSVGTNELAAANITLGQKNVKSTRGLLESFGMSTVFSNYVSTIQSIPLHRAFVSYLQGRNKSEATALLGNAESELVTIGGGDFRYDTYDEMDVRNDLPRYQLAMSKTALGTKPEMSTQ